MWDLRIVILGLLSRFLEVPRRANLIFDILSPVRPQDPTTCDDGDDDHKKTRTSGDVGGGQLGYALPCENR